MIRKKFICTLALALTAGMLAQAVVVIASEDIIGERQIIETTPINPEETIIEEELTPLAGEKIEADIIERDHRDMTREISPLRQADDAVLVDTSDMSIAEVQERLLNICREKGCI